VKHGSSQHLLIVRDDGAGLVCDPDPVIIVELVLFELVEDLVHPLELVDQLLLDVSIANVLLESEDEAGDALDVDQAETPRGIVVLVEVLLQGC
jgi:hypothetical protein